MYPNFIGIDIGKFAVDVAIHVIKSVKMYKNEEADLKRFYQEYKKYLQKGLVTL